MKYLLPQSVSLCKTLLILSLLFSFGCTHLAAKSKVKKAPIKDLVLIYDGGDHRTIDWNPSQFSSYVALDSIDAARPQWLFDGYLFLEIFWSKERGLATGYRSKGARKEDWIALIDKYLSPNRDLVALNTCVGNYRKRIGGKFERRKIVLSLPEPLLGQTDWGELDGKKLDFNNEDDRLKACLWYMDLLITRFKAANLKNLQLCGFYWLAEHATQTRNLVRSVSDYAHAKQLDLYWIPYFKADGFQDWKKFGFDHAYLQPNHFFNDKIPDSRIDETCELAKKYGLSLEMEFDDRALEEKGWGKRMEAYINAYEKNGIFATKPLAYYQASGTFWKLKHGSAADRKLYERLARIIAKRQSE